MAHHRYRVTKRLPWIRGGRLGPHLDWIGGREVVYEPGETIVLEDREVTAIFHYLEPTSDPSRVVLEGARTRTAAPAKRTMLVDIPTEDLSWMIRGTDEQLRRQGQIQTLVVRTLTRGKEVSLSDLAAAIQETPGAPVPSVLLDYVAKVLRSQPRRPGPKERTRTTWEDLAIQAYYQYELGRARQAYEANSRRPRALADVAKRKTAAAFGISKRTVERVLALGPKASSRLLT